MTKRFYSLLLAVSFLAAGSAYAAQAKMDPFDFHVCSVRILQNRSVQHELGVTVAQRAKMEKYAEAYNTELNAYLAELKKQNKGEPQGPDETMTMMVVRLKQEIMAVLKPAQLRRLREISLQVFALNGLMDETVAQKVGLSKDQLAKMQKTYEEGSKKANDLMVNAIKPVNSEFKNAKPKTAADQAKTKQAYLAKSKAAMDAVMPQVQKVRADTQAAILAIITPQQRSAFLALQGKPFKH